MRNFCLLLCMISAPLIFAQVADSNYNKNITTVRIAADTTYRASKLKEILFGQYYRDVWTTPIEAPVLDISKKFGGLKPVELGGGQQTRNVRLMDKDSNIYALRSIPKFPDKALPEEIRFGIFKILTKDQVSASLPYGAFIIAPMAEAAGLYHTNPVYYYVPDDPALGKYKDTISNMLALFEERPEDFKTPIKSIGYAETWLESDDIREKRDESIKHIIDQRLFLKSRLFDFIVGDWDRHEGQWNWGVYQKDGYKFYQPIPVDRDNAFFNFDGILPWFLGRKWAVPKFQRYERHIRDIEGFNYNARFVDRYFLNELEKETWMEIADSLKASLTDDVIKKSLKAFPDTIETIIGSYLEPRLISRKNNIDKYALEYYKYLAEVVRVKGSNDQEYFVISSKDNGQLKVQMYAKSGDELQGPYYSRTFLASETEEVLLYGEGGDDIFKIERSGDLQILIRIIGGDGKDSVINSAEYNTLQPNLLLYDYKNSYALSGEKIKLEISSDTLLNEYDYELYKRDYFGPYGELGYNIDESFYLKAGVLSKKYRFDPRVPASEQSLTVKFAFGNNAFSIQSASIFRDMLFREWDIFFNAEILAPGYPLNFFGYGNNTTISQGQNIEYYWVPTDQYSAEAGIQIPFKKITHIGLAPSATFTEINKTADRLINQYNQEGTDIFQQHIYGGLEGFLKIDWRDNKIYPTKGLEIFASATYNTELNGEKQFWKYKADVKGYIPVKPFVLAIRAGGASNSGSYEFYQGNTLGGDENLRGFRFDRFWGNSILYQNTDLRIKLSPFLGLFLFNDWGVIYQQDHDNEWHRGSGGGIFIAPQDIFSITATYAQSDEHDLVDIRFGFFF